MRGWLVCWLLLSLGWQQDFLLCPGDDRRISPGLLAQEWIFLIGCFVPSVKWPVEFTGLHFAGHCNQVDVIPILERTQLNVALLGILWLYARFGDGSPGFSWFEFCWSWWPWWTCLCSLKLTFSWRYWECILVGRSKWVGPHLGVGWFHMLVWTPVSTALVDFLTLQWIWGCTLGPLEASALGGKTYSPYGKVR